MTVPSPIAGIRACVFDAYGTLLDVNAAARGCRDGLGDRWEELAALWRAKQLEYTWLRSLMGRYADFWQVTGEALDYAMERQGLADPALRGRLMDLYRRLDAYPDAVATLSALRARGLRTAILSNGSPSMLAEAVDSARLTPLLDDVLSVDGLRVYKPHPSVYQLACDRYGLPPEAILFVSANGWDAGGAAAFGFRVAWLNRAGLPAERLPVAPAAVVGSLSAVLSLVAE
ncbi:haloacid dehalogenase type II [Azospirillum rugosum]|uniref:(S)-2-haloacid dehalogenase n=1 Tax=Azospirillum rugosum TaxID=416170 RepID=A0ABS4SQ40_9PROT|nr:haloacid dehalogenase type II [Azospirillum rugosum]MBP2294671.1 2-haloacid dehalogenase [Azospirillum rugosum]MDQ0528040.1 2-haloacid dehalogenase [Azospirillum rugosum]